MKNTDQVIQALTGCKSALIAREISERSGLKPRTTNSSLICLKLDGRVIAHPGDSPHKTRYSLNPDKVLESPRKPAPEKRKYTKHASTSTYRDVARNYLATDGASLIYRHLATTFALLESILDLDGADATLRAAFASHKEAIELAGSRS